MTWQIEARVVHWVERRLIVCWRCMSCRFFILDLSPFLHPPIHPKASGMAATSPHLTSIPQAVRVAASIDPSIDPGLKQQAIDYLTKVKQLSEETWQVCILLCCNFSDSYVYHHIRTACSSISKGQALPGHRPQAETAKKSLKQI